MLSFVIEIFMGNLCCMFVYSWGIFTLTSGVLCTMLSKVLVMELVSINVPLKVSDVVICKGYVDFRKNSWFDVVLVHLIALW